MRKLRVLSLFAGIGGLELGLEMTGGFETCLQVEIESYPRSVLAKRWPGVMRWPDVRTLLSGASPAKTSALPASEPELKVRAPVFGKSTGESFARYAPQSSSWKTSEGCFPWVSDEYSRTWPRSGMMRNGRCYRLRPKGLRTAGTASSLLPTPTEDSAADRSTKYAQGGTPLTMEAKTWPTPQHGNAKGFETLNEAAGQFVAEGQLNPDWVDALMGFPVGWSDVEFAPDVIYHPNYRRTWQTGEWEEDIPRLTQRKDLRRQRLMALGNAVVPQVAETIGHAILRAIEPKSGSGSRGGGAAENMR